MPPTVPATRAATLLLAPVFATVAVAMFGCTEPVLDEAGGPLTITVAPTAIHGRFAHGATAIDFTSREVRAQVVELHLQVGAVAFDATLDQAARSFAEDGHGDSFYRPELDALLALRDALADSHPELTDGLAGSLLLREVDRLAEAPAGLTLEPHLVDLDVAQLALPGCRDDGTTCLPGTSGSTYAVFDAGASGECIWMPTTYGGSNCAGRCGAGCNWLDNDYMWDCLDHDRCIDRFGGSVTSGNVDCGDEFWDAADDYVVTLGPYCSGGSLRTPPPRCGDGRVDAGEACDDGNPVGGDGCSATCEREPLEVTLTPAVVPLDRGQQVQVRARARYRDGSIVDVTATAAWSSSATTAVTVTGGGRLDALATTTGATVTATVAGIRGAAAVSVSDRACHVTINELQAGGATAADEWIELYNGCGQPAAVDGWTLVYRAATTVGATDSMSLVTLAGVLAPGELRLYASASAPAAIRALATATYAIGGSNGQLARSAGAVGLRSGPLSTGALVDAVAYGAVAAGHPFAEGGTAAAALDNGRSLYRAPFDGRDTNSGAGDLTLSAVGATTPRAPGVNAP